jgi:hypothetical protein
VTLSYAVSQAVRVCRGVLDSERGTVRGRLRVLDLGSRKPERFGPSVGALGHGGSLWGRMTSTALGFLI